MDSYDNVHNKWKPEVQHHGPDVPVILVGTKKDLRDQVAPNKRINKVPGKRSSKDSITSSERRVSQKKNSGQGLQRSSTLTVEALSTDAGHALCDLIYAVKYIECSAKTGEGVKEVFEEAIRAVVGTINKPKVKKHRCEIF